MSTLCLTAIGSTRVQSGVTFAANHFVTVVFLGQDTKRRLNNTSSKSQHQMKSRLLLNVVVGQSTAVLQLFTSENQTLLIGRDALLVLDFRLDIFDSVRGLDLEGDGLAGEGFHENLHRVAFLKQKNKTLTLGERKN